MEYIDLCILISAPDSIFYIIIKGSRETVSDDANENSGESKLGIFL